MAGRSAFRVGRVIGTVVAFAIVIAYAMLGDALRLTADDADGDVLVWYYANDAAAGQHLHGRAWVDGTDTWVVGVDINDNGTKIGTDDCPADCKSSYADFDFTLPPNARSGDGSTRSPSLRGHSAHTRWPIA